MTPKDKALIRLVQFQFVHSRWVCPKPYYVIAPNEGWGRLLLPGTTWKYYGRNRHHAYRRVWQTVVITHVTSVNWVPRFEQIKPAYWRPVKPTNGERQQWTAYVERQRIPELAEHHVPRWQWDKLTEKGSG